MRKMNRKRMMKTVRRIETIGTNKAKIEQADKTMVMMAAVGMKYGWIILTLKT
jgi:hypothetical protein